MTPQRIMPIIPTKAVIVRHFVCGRCAVANRPSRHDAGITLHIITYKRFDALENMVYFLHSCCICECSPTSKSGVVTLNIQHATCLDVKEWNAMYGFTPETDGYKE